MIKEVNKLVEKISSDTLLRGSTLVLAASLGSSVMNYVFHLLAGRILGPADYGVLASLFSLLYIVGVPGNTLVTTATKFASKYKAREDFEAVTHALVWTTKAVLGLAAVFIVGGFVFRGSLAHFLQISSPALVFFFFVFLGFSLLRSTPVGFLRGLLRFKSFAFVSLFGTFLKLVLGIGLAAVGLRVFGTILGMLIGVVLTLTVSVLLLGKNLRFPFEGSSFCWRELLSYAGPTVLVIFLFNALYNVDVVMVKHFFSPGEAGIYSSTVTMGRMVFFGLNAVSLVMFPLVSERHENGRSYKPVFRKSLFLVGLGAVAGFVLYNLVPKLLVGVLFGGQYFKAVPYLGSFALFMGIFSVVNLFVQFFLSVRDFRFLPALVVAALAQLGLLWQFHANLHQVIYVNIGVAVLSLFAMIWFYLVETGHHV